MRITCRNCGGDHPVWDCKRPATQSTTPAVKTLPVDTNPRVGSEGFPPFTSKPTRCTAPDRRAGDKDDQPIPSNARSEQPKAHGSSPCKGQGKTIGQQPTVKLVTAGETATPKRKVGRPKFITDLKAYKAMKQKEYRKKWKERENDTKLG